MNEAVGLMTKTTLCLLISTHIYSNMYLKVTLKYEYYQEYIIPYRECQTAYAQLLHLRVTAISHIPNLSAYFC